MSEADGPGAYELGLRLRPGVPEPERNRAAAVLQRILHALTYKTVSKKGRALIWDSERADAVQTALLKLSRRASIYGTPWGSNVRSDGEAIVYMARILANGAKDEARKGSHQGTQVPIDPAPASGPPVDPPAPIPEKGRFDGLPAPLRAVVESAVDAGDPERALVTSALARVVSAARDARLARYREGFDRAWDELVRMRFDDVSADALLHEYEGIDDSVPGALIAGRARRHTAWKNLRKELQRTADGMKEAGSIGAAESLLIGRCILRLNRAGGLTTGDES